MMLEKLAFTGPVMLRVIKSLKNCQVRVDDSPPRGVGHSVVSVGGCSELSSGEQVKRLFPARPAYNTRQTITYSRIAERLMAGTLRSMTSD